MSKRKKADSEFVPKVIEADDGEDFVAFIPHQIESDWHEKWGPLLEGFPLNILYAGITNNAQASSSASTSPNTSFEPEVIDYYPEDETCFVIVGGIKPRKKPSSPKKWLPTSASSRARRASVEVCYWPAPGTFHEDSERKEMCYFSNLPNDYFVRVIFEKRTNEWQTEKFNGKKLIRSKFGPDFDKVMIHTTMGGPEPDEL